MTSLRMSGYAKLPHLILPPNFSEKTLQFSAKTFFLIFFFGLHFILTKKRFNFRQRLFLGLHSISVTEVQYLIFTKVFSHAKCVWSRLQKRSPCKILQFRYSERQSKRLCEASTVCGRQLSWCQFGSPPFAAYWPRHFCELDIITIIIWQPFSAVKIVIVTK